MASISTSLSEPLKSAPVLISISDLSHLHACGCQILLSRQTPCEFRHPVGTWHLSALGCAAGIAHEAPWGQNFCLPPTTPARPLPPFLPSFQWMTSHLASGLHLETWDYLWLPAPSASARPAGSTTSRKHPASILANHLVDMVHLPKQLLRTTKQ